jgi:predicted PurR-regulated permease PerM
VVLVIGKINPSLAIIICGGILAVILWAIFRWPRTRLLKDLLYVSAAILVLVIGYIVGDQSS